MSKGNMLLGYARGKVGSLVFSRRRGEQITRSRNTNPTNPRTPKQIKQRTKMYAPVQFYKQSIATQFKYAFEDQRANETAFNAYMRHNIGIAPWSAKYLASAYAPIPFPAVMADGSTPALPAFIGNFTAQTSLGNAQVSGVAFIPQISNFDNMTIAEVSAIVISNNPLLREGDMLTFVGVKSSGLSKQGTLVLFNDEGSFGFSYAQMVLDLGDERNIEETGLVPVWNGSAEGAPDGFGFVVNHGQWDAEDLSLGACVIVSRKVNGKVVASNSILTINSTARELYNYMRTAQYEAVAALSYNVAPSPLLDPVKEK